MTNRDMASTTKMIALGGVVGALAGLLFAPKSGRETREIVRDKASKAKDKTEYAINRAKARTRQGIDELKAKRNKAPEKVAATARDLKDNIAEEYERREEESWL